MEKVGHVEKVQFGEGIVVRIEVLSVLPKQDEDAVYYAVAGECRVTVDGKMEHKGVVEWEVDPRDPPTDWRRVARVALNDLCRNWEQRLGVLEDALAEEELRDEGERIAAEQNPGTS